MLKFLVRCFAVVIASVVLYSCGNHVNIKEIRLGLHHNNVLQIQLNVLTDADADVHAEYWKAGDTGHRFSSAVSQNSTKHTLLLMNILPETNYAYQVITEKNGAKSNSKTYTFKSNELPLWLQEQFRASTSNTVKPPADFNDGLILINKRYAPGVACLVDRQGNIRWYQGDNLGFKVAHFTKEHTVLSLLGGNDEPTSYGHEILEVNLKGDTLLHLKKGQGDFKQTIHHEIIKNSSGQLVTIYVDKRVMDLSSIGGGKQDTVSGDGILVMDSHAKKVWQWSVFNAIDPLKDANLLKTKKDWMHANSLSFDKDGNYLMSFYNNGQIWKIDAKNGKVIWKFGKGGTIAKPAGCDFTQAHAVHINKNGNLMFFDNGVEKKQSGVFALKLDEKNNTSAIDMHINLPKDVFNGRMGSAYLINDTAVLVCCSKRHILLLTDKKGVLLWTMETAMPSYRAEFITSKQLAPFLKP